jgi:hypothetical protein
MNSVRVDVPCVASDANRGLEPLAPLRVINEAVRARRPGVRLGPGRDRLRQMDGLEEVDQMDVDSTED